jgi:hypothetical protein
MREGTESGRTQYADDVPRLCATNRRAASECRLSHTRRFEWLRNRGDECGDSVL